MVLFEISRLRKSLGLSKVQFHPDLCGFLRGLQRFPLEKCACVLFIALIMFPTKITRALRAILYTAYRRPGARLVMTDLA